MRPPQETVSQTWETESVPSEWKKGVTVKLCKNVELLTATIEEVLHRRS